MNTSRPGGGKYEAEIEELRKRLGAEGIALIVLGGKRGSGFGLQATANGVLVIRKALMDVLKQIENSEPINARIHQEESDQ